MRPRATRTAAIALLIAAAVPLILAPDALANFITPKAGGSRNANEIASLYKIVLYIAGVVFVIVVGTLTYSLIRFRAKKGAVAAQIHGNTRLEIGWTIAAAMILVILTVVTFIKLGSIINPPNSNRGVILSASTTEPTPPNGKRVTICIQGRQYIWRYTYGAGCNANYFTSKLPYSYQAMYAPAGVTVVLVIQSSDVIHSWWVPSLGGKVDAVPGYTTYTWFKAHTGRYHGNCAQLCGRNHAAMTALVDVVPPAEYLAKLAQLRQGINQANNQVGRLRQYLTAIGQF